MRSPVRVNRGYQIKNDPEIGYRYDGLYYVDKCERVRGKSGFYVCRFHLNSNLKIDQLEEDIGENQKSHISKSTKSRRDSWKSSED